MKLKKQMRLFTVGCVLTMVFNFLSAMDVCADQNLPSVIVELPENTNAIVVEKKTQTLFVYTRRNGKLKLEMQYPCSTGEVSGVKQKAGDRKTPEGIYFLIDEYEDKYLSPIYGKKAFPTDYPNLLDRRQGKNGSAIWIHGTNKKLVPMDSNGCVALENQNIVALQPFVRLHATPVIMGETIETTSLESIEKIRKSVHQLLNAWILSQEKGSYHDYLANYAAQYLPDITWWESWLEIRNKAAAAGKPPIDLGIARTGIYQYGKVVVALFDMTVKNRDNDIVIGTRKLFLTQQNPGYRIIGDEFQQVNTAFAFKNTFPLVNAVNSLISPSWKREDIIETVKAWLAAWSKKDMQVYASFYADSFFSDRMNKQQWVKRKTLLADKYGYIRVTGSDFKVIKKKKHYEVVFFQDYKSSGLTTQGTKRLKLVNKGGTWKIFRESWKKK